MHSEIVRIEFEILKFEIIIKISESQIHFCNKLKSFVMFLNCYLDLFLEHVRRSADQSTDTTTLCDCANASAGDTVQSKATFLSTTEGQQKRPTGMRTLVMNLWP